jgi:hypothetical protein
MPEEHPPRPATGTDYPFADDEPRGETGTPLAPPPIETPGPSVPAPMLPESDTEREEWADFTKPDAEQLDTEDPFDELVAEEESAAAAEARGIGGPAPSSRVHDPAMRPLYEAGEGEQEGWEQAEDDLIENASHGDGHANPLRDAISPELESDRSTAEYGGEDDLPSTAVTRDPDEGPDDPGAGPARGADLGS